MPFSNAGRQKKEEKENPPVRVRAGRPGLPGVRAGRPGRPGVPGGPSAGREARSTPGVRVRAGRPGLPGVRAGRPGRPGVPGGPSAGGEAGCTRGSECGRGGKVGHQVYPLTRQRLEGRKKKGNGEKRGTGNRGKKKKIGREPDPSVTRRGATCSRPARPKKAAGGRDRPRAQGVPVARRAGGAPARAGPRPCFANRPARGRPPGAPAAGRRRRPDGQTAGGRSRGRKTKACVEG